MRQLIRITAAAAALAATLVLVASAAGKTTPPALGWAPSAHNYGTIDAGETASKVLTLTNTGGSASGSLRIALSGSAAFSITADACTGTALGPHRSCAVTVKYAPATAGQSDAATLTASGTRPFTAPASASLTGASTAAATPDLTLSPGELYAIYSGVKAYSFGIDSFTPTTFTVTNNGTGASETPTVSGGGNGFSVTNSTCTSALSPAGTCTFTVSFTPPAGCANFTQRQAQVVVGADVIILDLSATCLF